jgi:hypothetical protein
MYAVLGDRAGRCAAQGRLTDSSSCDTFQLLHILIAQASKYLDPAKRLLTTI